MKKRASRDMFMIAMAAAICLLWMGMRAVGFHPPQPWTSFFPGICIFGASFLLVWGAEVLEMDLPQSVAIAIVALIGVLPEYAVDMYFAWTAGKDPTYAAYAAANMTGANRLLIGIGWPAVLFACWYKKGIRVITLTAANAPELVILAAATVYSFVIPWKASLSVLDSAVLLALFGVYSYLSAQAEVEEPELEGPALLIADMPAPGRRLTVAALFLFAACAIFLSAQPFAEGILELGRHFGIEEFVLVQWLAPLASEAPEFIIAILFALKGRPEVGLRALVSSKVNQWTLLVGMLPAAFALSAGSWAAMPLDARQASEIALTSAQSFFALVVLADLRFSFIEAGTLLVLFTTQAFFTNASFHSLFAGVYVLLGILLLSSKRRRAAIAALWRAVSRPR